MWFTGFVMTAVIVALAVVISWKGNLEFDRGGQVVCSLDVLLCSAVYSPTNLFHQSAQGGLTLCPPDLSRALLNVSILWLSLKEAWTWQNVQLLIVNWQIVAGGKIIKKRSRIVSIVVQFKGIVVDFWPLAQVCTSVYWVHVVRISWRNMIHILISGFSSSAFCEAINNEA